MGKADRKKLKTNFLDWQCQIRQMAMRGDGGRPSPGMRPLVVDKTGHVVTAALTVLLLPKMPEEATARFRFEVMKSLDPRETYVRALHYLQANYYQESGSFSDRMLATVPSDAPLANALSVAKSVTLIFAEGRKRYSVPCKVRTLEPHDAAHAAAIWHNRVFNPQMPVTDHVFAFDPDWALAWAEPGPEAREKVS